MRTAETLTVFALGGFGYGLCELIWRGYTHPTMFLLGGVCLLGLYELERRFSSLPLAFRCISGGIFITSLELVTGIMVNTVFGMGVWDYSDMPLNLFGQICPQFFVAWVFLCIPAFYLCKRLLGKFGQICV
ncbi:MAG: hypothetical protein IJW06_06615 [Clostridia bacterium]|nr:hypothetical protein [Clostridia bacterium]